MSLSLLLLCALNTQIASARGSFGKEQSKLLLFGKEQSKSLLFRGGASETTAGQQRYGQLHALETRETAATESMTQTAEWRALKDHARRVGDIHLRDLLGDTARSDEMQLNTGGIMLDWSRQKVLAGETTALLIALARRMRLDGKIANMRRGDIINTSEKRAVLHTDLRASTSEAVVSVRDRIWAFADAVRSREFVNAEGQSFESVIVVGIGGSYLGPRCVSEAVCAVTPLEEQRQLRFLANVDPLGFRRATQGLDPHRTLVIVVSKSWSTRETMRNAQLCKDWVLQGSTNESIVRRAFVACSSKEASALVEAWGIDSNERLFEFWDWVGGRFSSTSSAGLLPLALSCGSQRAREFLAGAHQVDEHFFTAPLERNMPVVMGLLGVWNVNFLGLGSRAVIPFSEALAYFPAHVQQLEMESNGKAVSLNGRALDYETAEIVFGEPGTNAQHSFFQLLHMGRCVPCDFIGFSESPTADIQGHDELMANFFAQPDALAVGRSLESLLAASDDAELCRHRTLSGDRPSLTLLFERLDAYNVGALLALYEHRCVVQGFVWDLNSFDQWGVELGKTLAAEIMTTLEQARQENDEQKTLLATILEKKKNLNPSTARLIRTYLRANKKQGKRGSSSSI